MPRKYRPPPARRRKAKRSAPHYVESLPEDGGVASQAHDEAVAAIELPETEPTVAERTPQPAGRVDSRATAPVAAKHISRDYSHVRAEVKRIVLVAGFLVISLMVTALLRN